MIKLKEIQSIYFIGIGGIGMSALARYFKNKNINTSGYDKVQSELTQKLQSEGINIHYEENISIIPKDVDLVVYTPAISSNNEELIYYQENQYNVLKRSDILKIITEDSYNICIAGTHGKTTITTMIAHLFRHSGVGCNAFLGGISVNYHTNFWSNENNIFVIEADEYDRSFLKLSPDVAVITATDSDHLDIYGTNEEVENAFIQFSGKIKDNGCLVSKYGLRKDNELNSFVKFTYSLDNYHSDVVAKNIRTEDGSYFFDIEAKNWGIENIQLHMGGLHNIENAVAAITVARYMNISNEKIKESLVSFKGVKRRFEYILKNKTHILIDDYAHHPEELKALISGVRSLFSEKKCTLIFQPHLFSRTNDFAIEFAQSLDFADEVIILPIYPARELEIEGVSSELILKNMLLPQKQILNKDAMLEWVKVYQPELIVMCGAGDIDLLVDPVKNILLYN